MHQKFDLKGSTYKRKAKKRREKETGESKIPTYKDLDFLELHPGPSASRTVIHGSGASAWSPVYACTLQIYFLNAAQTAGPLSHAT